MINFCSKKNLIGLNISDYSIKVVDAQCVKGKMKVVSSGMLVMDPGVLSEGRIIDPEKLKEHVKKVFAESSPKKIISKEIAFAIPEKQVYSHIFEINASQEKDLNKLAYDEALSSIPLNREDLVFSYKVLENFKVVDNSKNEDDDLEEDGLENEGEQEREIKMINKIRVLVVGVQNEVVEEWKNFFNSMDLKIDYFSLEPFSTFQGLYEKLLDHPICLVDIGANITNVSIISENGLMYSNSINAAGNLFSEKLKDGFGKKKAVDEDGYSHEEASQLKREIGVLSSEKFVNVPIILKSAVLPIVEEIRMAIKYYNLKTGKMINEIVLVGGSSQLKGINEYMESNLSGLKHELSVRNIDGINDEIANKDVKVISGKLLHDDLSIEFAEALGLSFKKYNRDLDKFAPIIPADFNANEYALSEEDLDEEESGDNKQESLAEEGSPNWLGKHKQLVKLVALLVIAALSISWAFWYRGETEKKVRLAAEQQKTYEKTISVMIPVAVEKADYNADAIKGRVYKDIQNENLAIDKLVAKSKDIAVKQVKAGEKLWENHLNVLDEKRVVYPVVMEWLIYNEKDVMERFITESKRQHNNDSDFGFRNVEILKLENDGGKYYLIGNVNISTKTKPTAAPLTTSGGMENKQEANKAAEEKIEATSTVDGGVSTSTKQDLDIPVVDEARGDQNGTSTSSEIGTSTNLEIGTSSIQASSTLLSESDKKFVSIDDSGLMRLNVRVASSTKSDFLTTIYSKNVYELLEVQEGWLKIKVNEKQEGWVSATYAKILD